MWSLHWTLLGIAILASIANGATVIKSPDMNALQGTNNKKEARVSLKKNRIKRSGRGYARGQTQSQYLNFGNPEQDGKAEAEATEGGSRSTVSGSHGMGQAQSQFSFGDCTSDCGSQSFEYPPDPYTDSKSKLVKTGTSDVSVGGPQSIATGAGKQQSAGNDMQYLPGSVSQAVGPGVNAGYRPGTPGGVYNTRSFPGQVGIPSIQPVGSIDGIRMPGVDFVSGQPSGSPRSPGPISGVGETSNFPSVPAVVGIGYPVGQQTNVGLRDYPSGVPGAAGGYTSGGQGERPGSLGGQTFGPIESTGASGDRRGYATGPTSLDTGVRYAPGYSVPTDIGKIDNARDYPSGRSGSDGQNKVVNGYLPGTRQDLKGQKFDGGYQPSSPGSVPGYPAARPGLRTDSQPIDSGRSDSYSGGGYQPASPNSMSGYPAARPGTRTDNQSVDSGRLDDYSSGGYKPSSPGLIPAYPAARPGLRTDSQSVDSGRLDDYSSGGYKPSSPGSMPGYPAARPGTRTDSQSVDSGRLDDYSSGGYKPSSPGIIPAYPAARPGLRTDSQSVDSGRLDDYSSGGYKPSPPGSVPTYPAARPGLRTDSQSVDSGRLDDYSSGGYKTSSPGSMPGYPAARPGMRTDSQSIGSGRTDDYSAGTIYSPIRSGASPGDIRGSGAFPGGPIKAGTDTRYPSVGPGVTSGGHDTGIGVGNGYQSYPSGPPADRSGTRSDYPSSLPTSRTGDRGVGVGDFPQRTIDNNIGYPSRPDAGTASHHIGGGFPSGRPSQGPIGGYPAGVTYPGGASGGFLGGSQPSTAYGQQTSDGRPLAVSSGGNEAFGRQSGISSAGYDGRSQINGVASPGAAYNLDGLVPSSGISGTYPGGSQLGYPASGVVQPSYGIGGPPGGRADFSSSQPGIASGYPGSIRGVPGVSTYPGSQTSGGLYPSSGPTFGAGGQLLYPPGTGETGTAVGGSRGSGMAGTGIASGIGSPGRGYGGPANLVGGVVASGSGGTDDAFSQAESSVREGQAAASAQGKKNGGSAKTQVSGTYSAGGTFSASAMTSDSDRSANAQVSGNSEGAMSQSQGQGGVAQSQSQVQVNARNGGTKASSQSGGIIQQSQSEVQANDKGGLADAQSSGPGQTSSQAQIGFRPRPANDGNIASVGGGQASAQSSSLSGQSQSQIHGNSKFGISYHGAAQSASGTKEQVATYREQNRELFHSISQFGSNDGITDRVETNYNQALHSSALPNELQLKSSGSDKSAAGGKLSAENLIDDDDEEQYTDYADGEEDDDDYYNENGVKMEGQASTQKSSETTPADDDSEPAFKTYSQRTPSQSQKAVIIADPKEKYTIVQKQNGRLAKHHSSRTTTEMIPSGFRGTVNIEKKFHTKSLEPHKASDKNKSHNSTEDDTTYDTASSKKPERERERERTPNSYVTVTKSVTGSLDTSKNPPSEKKAFQSTYYTKSSTCGYFTFSCNIVYGANGRSKICRPKAPANGKC